MKRPLTEAVLDPGFTPSSRDVGALVELLLDERLAKHAQVAIGRVGPAALDTLVERFEHAAGPLRPRLARTIGRFVHEPQAAAFLTSTLADKDAKTRRNAAIALGHLCATGGAPTLALRNSVEEALLAAWQRDPRPEMRRSIAASLGKVGTERSLALLREAAGSADAELARIAQRAAMMIERTQSRSSGGQLNSECAPAKPVAVVALARGGLEELLAEELAGAPGIAAVKVVAPGRVTARLEGPMGSLFAARTMLSFRFPLPAEPLNDGEPLEYAVARAATGAEARRILATWTVGPVRYRIAWATGGHRRALTWATARAISSHAPDFINDPTSALWELVVSEARGSVSVELASRALDDPRFRWRRRDVPASSHPTIAAALARVAGVYEQDVIWDPFVGAGAELIERALAGPYLSLAGSDIHERAIEAARENLNAAGVSALLQQADALAPPPGPARAATLILTNPPMARRSSRVPELPEMLDRFVAHAASVLVPGGRLVWIAPWPKRARAAAERARLVLEWARVVDLGGYGGEMQRWVKGK